MRQQADLCVIVSPDLTTLVHMKANSVCWLLFFLNQRVERNGADGYHPADHSGASRNVHLDTDIDQVCIRYLFTYHLHFVYCAGAPVHMVLLCLLFCNNNGGNFCSSLSH